MIESPLLNKSKEFALQIIKECNEIKKKTRESVLTNQLLRSDYAGKVAFEKLNEMVETRREEISQDIEEAENI